MADDHLIAGAAAPVRRRRIASTEVLDAIWVVLTGLVLIVSSFFALIDLPGEALRTGNSPMRFFVLDLPLVAIAVAVVGAVRGRVMLTSIATGMLAPSIALTGSLAIALFLDEASAFADVGVAISLATALFGVVMLVRWFVYHPLPLLGDQRRPVPLAGRSLIALGLGLIAILLVTTVVSETSSSSASVGQTLMMSTVALVTLAAGVTRTIQAAWLACGACAAQIVAVLVVAAGESSIALDSDLVLRTGILGLAALAVTVGVSVAAALRAAEDPEVAPDAADVESWRWHLDD